MLIGIYLLAKFIAWFFKVVFYICVAGFYAAAALVIFIIQLVQAFTDQDNDQKIGT